MEKVLLYFVLNFAGFYVLYLVWKRLQKPPPIDFTTIPGLKCANLAETEEAITFAPGRFIVSRSRSRGCLDDDSYAPCPPNEAPLEHLLRSVNRDFGALASVFLGPRYVVLIGETALLAQLKPYWRHSAGVCPWAIGSVVLGDRYFWQRHSVRDWAAKMVKNPRLSTFLTASRQYKLLTDFPESGRLTFETSSYKSLDSRKSDGFSPFLTFAFSVEVDLQGHRIPANIPILFTAGECIANGELAEVLDQTCTFLHKFSPQL